jgi:hypothetical protein
MKKNVKVALGLFFTIGTIGTIAYFVRQGRLMKNISVEAGSVDWSAAIIEAAQLYSSGQSITQISLPLDLTLTNDSNTDVTINKVDLDLYAEQDLIGTISTDFEQLLAKKSVGELSVDFNFVEGADLSAIALAEASTILPFIDAMDYTIVGSVRAKASVFESINLKYRSTFTLGELMSGNATNSE